MDEGSSLVEVYLAPEINLIVHGYTWHSEPVNWLARLLWRWLKVKVVFKEPTSLYDLLPRIPRPKAEWNIKDIN